MASLPVFKLGALLAKQISKPLAKIIKEKSLINDFLKLKIVIPVAQRYHRIDFTVRMKLLGLGSPGQVPLLSERKAIELGAELISEFFVLGTAIAAILLEYLRQSKNKKHKDIRMSTDIENLHDRNELVLTDIEENLKLVNDLKKSINEQKSELGKINGRMETVEDKLNTKMNIASSQTSKEKAIGKVLYSSNSNINPNADVQNSMIYQIAHEAVKSLIH